MKVQSSMITRIFCSAFFLCICLGWISIRSAQAEILTAVPAALAAQEDEEDTDADNRPLLPSPNASLPDNIFPKSDSDGPVGPKEIDDSLRSHWVMLDEDGNLRGRISTIQRGVKESVPAKSLEVFLIRRGKTIKQVLTSSAGEFLMRGIDPGVYTLVASGDNGFLAYGINVVPSLEDVSLTDGEREKLTALLAKQPVGEEVQIDAAAIPPTFTTLRQITKKYLPADVGIRAGMRSGLKGLEDLFEDEEVAPGGFIYALTEDGSLVGRVQPVATYDGEPAELEKMNVFLLQDDAEVAREPIDEEGYFEVADLDPGVYAIVVAGDQGFAALSVQLTAPKEDDDVDASRDTFTSLAKTMRAKQDVGNAVQIAIVTDPRDLKVVKQTIDPTDVEPADDQVADDGAPSFDQFFDGNADAQSFAGGDMYFEPFPEAPIPQNLPPINIPSNGFDPQTLVQPLTTAAILAAATVAAVEIGDAVDDDDFRSFPASPISTQP